MFVAENFLAASVLWIIVGAVVLTRGHALLPRPYNLEENNTEAELLFPKVLEAVLGPRSDLRCSILFFSEVARAFKALIDGFVTLRVVVGVGVFEVKMDSNGTDTHLLQVVAQARQLQLESWCVTIVVVSDNRDFLAAFSERSLSGRLLVPSTRLLALTRLPVRLFREDKQLRTTFSTMNTVFGTFQQERKRFTLYYLEPYSRPEDQPIPLARWSQEEGLSSTSPLPLFFEKYIRFRRRPTLTIATEAYHSNEAQRNGRRKDPTCEYLAQGINFNYRYGNTPDGTYGSKQDDGSWSGLIGAVARKEADFSLGPVTPTPSRLEVVDFTSADLIEYYIIMGGRGVPQVNPWGFLFPLSLLVWAAVLAALLLLPLAMLLLSTCASSSPPNSLLCTWAASCFEMIRVLLGQDHHMPGGAWWWRRPAIGGWILTALVLIKSYSGNLMSVLAVRYVQQPYQSLADVAQDPSVTMIWETNTSVVQYIRTVENGIYRKLAEAEKSGRTKFEPLINIYSSVDKLVRTRGHVLIAAEMLITVMINHDVTYTGRCDFYKSRDKFLPTILTMIGQKNSPLVPALSRRITDMTEAGLFYYWVKLMTPNSTSCATSPTKITVSTTLSVANLWGTLVVLISGYMVGLLVLVTEVLVNYCTVPAVHSTYCPVSTSCS